MIIPKIWKNKIHVPNHQPNNYSIHRLFLKPTQPTHTHTELGRLCQSFSPCSYPSTKHHPEHNLPWSQTRRTVPVEGQPEMVNFNNNYPLKNVGFLHQHFGVQQFNIQGFTILKWGYKTITLNSAYVALVYRKPWFISLGDLFFGVQTQLPKPCEKKTKGAAICGNLGKFKTLWLVVDLPLWKMMEFVSWDDDIPNWMESNNSCSKAPTSY